MQRGSQRFIVADPLRGLAALGVFIFHAAVGAGLTYGFFTGHPYAALGVIPTHLWISFYIAAYFFFALSGYLLGRPFLAAYVHGKPMPSVRQYLRNRGLRILPGYMAVFVLSALFAGTRNATFWQVIAVPLMLQVYVPSSFSLSTMAHYWTLDDEVVYYLMLPICAWLAVRRVRLGTTPERRRRIAVAAILIVSIVSLAFSGTVSPSDQPRTQWFPLVVYMLSPGMLLAILSTWLPDRLPSRPLPNWLPAVMLLAAGLIFVFYASDIFQPTLWSHHLAGAVIIGLVMGAALIRQWTDGRAWRVLDNRPMQWIGKRSYTLYLIHPLVLLEIIEPLHRGRGAKTFAIYVLVGLLVLIPLTGLGYEVLERPWQALQRNWKAPSGPGGPRQATTSSPTRSSAESSPGVSR